ncbi:PIN domain-containing protein [uncultured Spirosoma sp.]|uniref:PIN domain-containing protein n=1 Tax=uncultured Spirosoma sp. TaxID=278208 RepID=UPI00338F0ED8
MRYVLDTNIVIAYLRKHPLAQFIDDTYDVLSSQNDTFISVVTVGELRSLALQNNWGTQRTTLLNDYLNRFLVTDINVETVIQRYAIIDAYSQGRLATNPLSGSARNMSKNDLWISATASVLGATLLTMDRDFDHIHSQYVNVAYIRLNNLGA